MARGTCRSQHDSATLRYPCAALLGAGSADLRADLGVALQPAVGTESGDLRVYGAAAGAWPCRSISVRTLDRRLLGPRESLDQRRTSRGIMAAAARS